MVKQGDTEVRGGCYATEQQAQAGAQELQRTLTAEAVRHATCWLLNSSPSNVIHVVSCRPRPDQPAASASPDAHTGVESHTPAVARQYGPPKRQLEATLTMPGSRGGRKLQHGYVRKNV